MNWHDALKKYWGELNGSIVNDGEALCFDQKERVAFERKKQQLTDRKVKIVKAISSAQVVGCHYVDGKEHVRYGIHHQFVMKQYEEFYIEEWVQPRKAVFKMGKMIDDKAFSQENIEQEKSEVDSRPKTGDRDIRFKYDRLQAVKYAERWWNSYNPAYRHFDVDCTNYVSQCLHAGGAPMRGYPNRSKGWWFQNNNWSFSWSVANALRWYLSGSQAGLQATEVFKPNDLELGDVICYDFDGDGTWQHNTIVVAKDGNNMPLVNAHTTNSRMRYWAYEDSTAWTDQIQYKFFHIRSSEQ